MAGHFSPTVKIRTEEETEFRAIQGRLIPNFIIFSALHQLMLTQGRISFSKWYILDSERKAVYDQALTIQNASRDRSRWIICVRCGHQVQFRWRAVCDATTTTSSEQSKDWRDLSNGGDDHESSFKA